MTPITLIEDAVSSASRQWIRAFHVPYRHFTGMYRVYCMRDRTVVPSELGAQKRPGCQLSLHRRRDDLQIVLADLEQAKACIGGCTGYPARE
jgi:hypothetical protein